MSIESVAIALHHSQATGTAKIVLIGIANHDGDGGAWPTVDTLARYANVTRRNAINAINRLEELHEIKRVYGAGGDHSVADSRRPNLYRFLLSCPASCDHTKNHRTSRQVELLDDLSTGVSVATPHVGSDTGGGVGSDTQTVPVNQPPRQRREAVVLNVRARVSEPDVCDGCKRPFRAGTQHGLLCRDCRQRAAS